jgi:hypothetical protein
MYSTAYVILAGGRGTRMGRIGDTLNKALLPLNQRAILTHLIELGPPGAELIICTGYRADQVRDYVELAHPELQVTWVPLAGWDQPGAGAGAALLAARGLVGDRRMVTVTCDTLWEPDPTLWDDPLFSWAAHAPLPAGSAPERWCRLALTGEHRVTSVVDKSAWSLGASRVYTGLAHIAAADLPIYWRGIETGQLLNGELRDPNGLAALVQRGKLTGKRITWTDTGDMMAYRRAVILRDGYDWSKEQEVTWVLPDEGRVVKWWADYTILNSVIQRRSWLAGSDGQGDVPEIADVRGQMLALEYVPGVIGYDALKTSSDLHALTSSPMLWFITRPVEVDRFEAREACRLFYRLKTLKRVTMLRQPIRALADDVIAQVNWDRVINYPLPAHFHGDFNLGNMIFDGVKWHLIDWRSSFGAPGELWGDFRYDAAKFLAGLRVRWDWARHGDFTPWPLGRELYPQAQKALGNSPGIEEIGVLSLLSSAPLHEVPLDEVLVTRAAEWMSELR